LPNSADSLPSERRRRTAEALGIPALLCILTAVAAAWSFRNGYILYYGDAQSHLNISRSIIDSRTPGYDQLGNVWLPVLHVICLPFVGNDWLWRTGLAGAIPVAMCLVIAGVFFYLAAKDAYRSAIAALVVLSCFVLNPNVLYLGSIPMTEVVFLAGLAVLLFALLRFRATQKRSFVALAVLASWWMSLTRYDGWFLIPFAAIWFAVFASKRRWILFLVFGALASLAPLYWIAHNWWETGNALDFFNGPYSAKAIQGSHPYPGYHDWKLAILYYMTAGELCTGVTLILLGAAGMVCAARKRVFAPVLFLMLTPMFYVWSMHSSSTPIFVPSLWPYTYYNSRYGIEMVALSAFAAGAIVLVLPQQWCKLAFALPLLSIAPWLIHPVKDNWICWKESQVNSISRRAWTEVGARFLDRHYAEGQGILTASGSGDVAGIFCRAGIPLRETIYLTNDAAWWANTARPDLLHQALWAVVQAGDPVAKALGAAAASSYRVRERIQVQGAPALEIYERTDAGAHR
jgi:hypothetical protein